MFLHETSSQYATAAWATAYGVGLVSGTAILIAVADDRQAQWQGGAGEPTHAEVVMQGAMQRALASPKTAVLAGHELHERRDL